MRQGWRRVAAIGVLALGASALAACSSSKTSKTSTATTPTTSAAPKAPVVQVGISDPKDPTIAVLQYMPAAVTVAVNTPLTFDWTGTHEPHSVTFFPPGQQAPTPDKAEPLFQGKPAAGPYDGSTLLNSGLQPLGPAAVAPMSVTFSKAGTYKFQCVIHVQMTGTVTVVDTGGAADTAAQVKTKGDAELKQWLAEGESAKAAFDAAGSPSTPNADGSKTWHVKMGTSTPHTDILAFSPLASVKAGDKVEFINDSGAPHTATFFNNTTPFNSPLDPAVNKAAPGPSPQTLTSTGLFNTGVLPPNAPPGHGPPLIARSFTFATKTAGTYQFVCVYHQPSGMGAVITVA